MILRSIRLENIRSYTTQEIDFPDGSTLLSGDIGAGKSSILLGIEFALFGIRRKHLDGTALLRHGKNKGSVELKLEIDGKEIIVKRTLKREKDKVEQDSGYILINGVKKDATAVELKTIILDLLGYPRELVTKTKNLVYRYTVYTPQEEMKEILSEEEEIRLDTLRKVFGIDRYKRITENSLIVSRGIKEKRKELSGKISDIEEKRKQKAEAAKEIEELEKSRAELAPLLEEAKQELIEKKRSIYSFEANIKEYNSLKREIEMLGIEEKNKHNEFSRLKREIDDIDAKMIELRKEAESKETASHEKIGKEIAEKEEVIGDTEKKHMENNMHISEHRIRIKNADDIKTKILRISRCPTCEQEVSKEHKESVLKREKMNMEDSHNKILEHMALSKEFEAKLIRLKKEMQELRTMQNNASITELKRKNIAEKLRLKDRYIEEQKEIKKRIGEIFVSRNEAIKKSITFKDIEEEYLKLKKDTDDMIEKERNLAIKNASIEKEIQGISKAAEIIGREIAAKEKAKDRFLYLGELLNWIEEGFVKLVALMEKQVMLNVHHEFNELFQRWFDVLMEDETLNVRIDDSFTPIVEQNGYETTVSNLSGGERTAAALAYRLALNKVVNDLMSGIKTKDIIILDEPTDGFSSEQLDKVREVLEQIGIKQTIIVSHESKIESFVDNVIRINKNEHVSGVVDHP